jgi:RNA-directed DNA polymerase
VLPSLVRIRETVLEPTFEADLEPNAHGYRPRRRAQDAVRKVHQLLRAGYTDVVDADLSKYFDTIPHAELVQSVARRIVDRRTLHLIKMWLTTPVVERNEKGGFSTTGKNSKGTPQGGHQSFGEPVVSSSERKSWRMQMTS